MARHSESDKSCGISNGDRQVGKELQFSTKYIIQEVHHKARTREQRHGEYNAILFRAHVCCLAGHVAWTERAGWAGAPIVGSVAESVLSRSFYLCFVVFFLFADSFVAMIVLQCLLLLLLLCFS